MSSDEWIWDGMKSSFWTWSNYLPSHLLTFLFQEDEKMNGGPSKRLLRRQAHPWGAFPPRFWSQVSFGGLEGKNLVVVEQLIHFVKSWTCMGLYLEVAHPSPTRHSKLQIYTTTGQHTLTVENTYMTLQLYFLYMTLSSLSICSICMHIIACTHTHIPSTHNEYTQAIHVVFIK